MEKQTQIEKQNVLPKDENIIYISPMKYDIKTKRLSGVTLEVYVLRIIELFKTNKELYISSRGNAILRAINLAELLKRDFKINIKNIETSTETLKQTRNRNNKDSYVSVIKITIMK